jgi:hypothetical protein
MKSHCDGFWRGGSHAWRRGLRDVIRRGSDRLKAAETDEERSEAQRTLERLKEQEADANRNGRPWLFSRATRIMACGFGVLESNECPLVR